MKTIGRYLDNLAYFFAVMLGVFVLITAISVITFPPPPNNQRINSKRHIQEIATAFQFEYSPNEAVYVSYSPSRDSTRLEIVVEGLISRDDFLLRFRGGYEERYDFMGFTDEDGQRPFAASGYDIDIVQRDLLSYPERLISVMEFSDTEEANNVKFLVSWRGSTPEEFRDVIQLLNKRYMRGFRKWLQPIFVMPTLIQWALIAFIIIRRIIHKTRTKKGQNEGETK